MPFEVGEIYVPANAEEIRDDFLTDIRLEAIKQGVPNPPVLPGSDWYILGTALSNIGLIQYSNLRISDDNMNVLTATGEDLDNIREAYGLPVVPASPATGAIVVTTQIPLPLTIPDGTEFVLPNGLRGKVSPTALNVFNGDEVVVVTIDTGEDANLGAGEIVQFVSPPVGVQTEAIVSVSAPLAGGVSVETDARKRARILNRLQTVPAGGNWGDLVETSLNAIASLQYAFVYPALGGPASAKVVLCKNQNTDTGDYSRQVTAAATNIVRAAIFSKMPSPMEIVVQSVEDESFDATISVDLPSSATSGGNGQGWIDQAPWPPLVPADAGRSTIFAASGTSLSVNANAFAVPIPGQTHILWWSSVDQRFYKRLVVAVSAPALPPLYNLTIDAPLVDSNNNGALVGEYICPATSNYESYGNTWRTVTNGLGPGENTADSNRLPRSARHPFEEDGWYFGLTIQQLRALVTAHPEIADAAWAYRSLTEPTVPVLVASAPRILKPNNFGIYEI